MSRLTVLGASALVVALAAPHFAYAGQGRPDPNVLPVPLGGTREQLLLGDKIFHGEAADGKCAECHGADAKGTANGNDLTLGMWIWGDGSVAAIKTTIGHNMKMAPGMDGNLSPGDIDAVIAYVWALGHQKN